MEFAAPFAVAVAGLLVPVVALFLVKPRPRPIRVATMQFWDAAAPRTRRKVAWGRLRNPVALLLAVLVVVALTAAAAGPYSRPADDAVKRVVFVVDDSIGMRATDASPDRLTEAIRRARAAVAVLPPGVDAGVVTAGGRPRVACGLTNDPGQALDALASLKPTDAPRRLPEAVELARQLANGGRVVVFSGAPDRPTGDDIDWHPIGGPAANVAVTALRPRRLDAGQDFELLVEVTNASPTATETRLVLKLDDRELDAWPLKLEPGQVWQTVTRQSADGGTLTATVTGGDVLPADDTATAVLPEPDPLTVVLYAPANARGTEVVQAVLDTLPFVRKPVPVRTDAGPPRPGSVGVYYRTLPAELPATPVVILDPPTGSPFWELLPPVTDSSVRVTDGSCPLFARLTLPTDAAGQPRGLRPLAGAQAVASVASGEAVALDIARPGIGRLAVMSFDLEGGNLSFRPTFVALLGNAVQYVAGQSVDAPDPPDAGDVATVALSTTGPFELRGPLGASPLTGNVVGPLDRAGVWAVVPVGSSQPVWQTAPRPAGRADAALTPADHDQPPPSALSGRPAWVWLALAAGLLLVYEWVSYHRRWTA